MSYEIAMNLIAYLVGIASVYGGIRADLKHIHERIAEQQVALCKLNDRLDAHIIQSRH